MPVLNKTSGNVTFNMRMESPAKWRRFRNNLFNVVKNHRKVSYKHGRRAARKYVELVQEYISDGKVEPKLGMTAYGKYHGAKRPALYFTKQYHDSIEVTTLKRGNNWRLMAKPSDKKPTYIYPPTGRKKDTDATFAEIGMAHEHGLGNTPQRPHFQPVLFNMHAKQALRVIFYEGLEDVFGTMFR